MINNNIILISRIEITNNYKGNSKFQFWKDIQIGDIIEITNIVERLGRSSAARYKLLNTNNNLFINCGGGELSNYLRNLEYKQL